jgi:hypothetical protein
MVTDLRKGKTMFSRPAVAVWAALAASALLANGGVAAPAAQPGGQAHAAAAAELHHETAPPPGTQARALLSDIPPTERALAGQLINADRVRDLVLFSKSLETVPSSLQVALRKGLAGYVSARPVGPPGSTWVAIDVRGCTDGKVAMALARAAAEGFAGFIDEYERQRTQRQLAKLEAERNELLKKQAELLARETAARAATPAAAMQERRNLVSIRLQLLAPMLLEAEMARAQAEASLKVLQKRMEVGGFEEDPDVRRALEADPILSKLNLQRTELELELSNLPGTTTAPHPAAKAVLESIRSVRRQIDRREDDVMRQVVRAAAQMKHTALAAATQRMKDLTERLDRARVEAQDLEAALARIRSLEEEARRPEASMAELERRMLELRIRRRQAPGKSAAQFKIRAVFPVP